MFTTPGVHKLSSQSLYNARYLVGGEATRNPDAQPKFSAYPGRFRNESYPELSIRIEFVNNAVSPQMLQYRRPYNATCSPGLHCQFSDTSWHEFGWSNTFVSFPESPKTPNDCLLLDGILNGVVRLSGWPAPVHCQLLLSTYICIYSLLFERSLQLLHIVRADTSMPVSVVGQ